MIISGGNWTTQNKTRPGAYMNFVSATRPQTVMSDRGVGILPMILSWGAEHEIITVLSEEITNGKSLAKVGVTAFDEQGKTLTLMLSNCYKALVYRLNSGGERATAAFGTLAAKAKYPGVFGNYIQIAIVATKGGRFDVKTYTDGTLRDSQNIAEIAELNDNDFVEFSGYGALTEYAGKRLSGGTDGETANESYTEFFNLAGLERWQTMAIPIAAGGETPSGAYKLDAPQGLILNGNELTWNAVSGAEEYQVYANGAMLGVAVEAEYDLSNVAQGSYLLTVKAMGNGVMMSNSDLSAALSFVKAVGLTQLPAPTGVSANNASKTVTWSAVANATGYEVYANGAPLWTGAGVLCSASGLTQPGVYAIAVKAKGDGATYGDSSLSAAVQLTVAVPLLAPAGVALNGTMLTWNVVANASGYSVRDNETQIGTATGASYDLQEITAVGTHAITITANGDGITRLDSAPSLAVNYIVPGYEGTILNSAGETMVVVSDPSSLQFVEAIVSTGANVGRISPYASNPAAFGRAAANNMVLAVNGGETVSLSGNTPNGLYYTFAEFSSAPVGQSSLTVGGVGAGVWFSDARALRPESKYIIFGFKNGDGNVSFTQSAMEVLGSYIVISQS
ncbi:MAG: hypothetical protein LBL35_09350 [Clostridiales bacterium]|jgi:hypothetical protein|nr:hypothetical protein [Clostridiales bacterium]